MAFSVAGIGQLMSHIDNKLGLYFLLSLIPLILLYLIRPRPQEKTIPSLMFIMKQFHKQKSYSFFRILMRDILFLVQLLVLLLFASAAMHPFIETNQQVDAEYVVLVLDISASMNVKEGLTARFDRMISEAKNNAKGKISIIAAQNVPYVLLEQGERSAAMEILNGLKPTDGLSAIGESMLVAEEFLEDKEGNVVVISDFINTDPVDPEVAKKTLEAKGNTVIFIDVKKDAENVGVVNIEFLDDETEITIQNFNNETVTAEVTLNKEERKITLSPLGVEQLFMKQKPGVNTIKMDVDDDFSTDNAVYISVPDKKETSILIISNNQKNFLLPAIEAYAEAWNQEASVEMGTPPIMPVIEHDIIIISEADEEKIPKAIANKIISLVRDEGATLIVTAQRELKKSAFAKYLPVEIGEYKEEEKTVYIERAIAKVTEGITFPKVEAYFTAIAKEKTTVIAALEDKTPLIALGSLGEGKVVYLGYIPGKNRFKYDISYPMFWQQLIDYLIGKESVDSLNYNIGEKLLFETETKIKTPTREKIAAEVMFDEVGVYTIQNKKYGVNLVNKVESQVNFKEKEFEFEKRVEESQEKKGKKIITKYFLWGLLALLCAELLYVKFRGDL